jgi:hypothetical protein
MTTTTNGKWSMEDYTVENDGRNICCHRLLHDGKVVIEEILDSHDLVNLFAISLIEAGFTKLARDYHERALMEDEGELEIMGPSCCPLAFDEVLAFCSGDFGKMIMPNAVCSDLDLPSTATYAQGVAQFHVGYQDHATVRHQRISPTPEERARIEAERKTWVQVHVEDAAFLKELEEMEG